MGRTNFANGSPGFLRPRRPIGLGENSNRTKNVSEVVGGGEKKNYRTLTCTGNLYGEGCDVTTTTTIDVRPILFSYRTRSAQQPAAYVCTIVTTIIRARLGVRVRATAMRIETRLTVSGVAAAVLGYKTRGDRRRRRLKARPGGWRARAHGRRAVRAYGIYIYTRTRIIGGPARAPGCVGGGSCHPHRR